MPAGDVKTYAAGANAAAADGVAAQVTFDPIAYTKAGLNDDVQNGFAQYSNVEGNDTYTYSYTVAEDTTALRPRA